MNFFFKVGIDYFEEKIGIKLCKLIIYYVFLYVLEYNDGILL